MEIVSLDRGKTVLEKVKGERFKKETVSFLKGLPSMLSQNGLGQTVAFMMAKGKENGEMRKILDIFADLLSPGKKPLIETILHGTAENYRDLQDEAVEYAGWLKKFGIAFSEGDKKPEKDKKKEKK